MGALQSAFPIIFLVALCIIIGVAAFIFLSNRRKREGFTEFAQRHGWTYAARPSGKAADLFVVLEAKGRPAPGALDSQTWSPACATAEISGTSVTRA
jgi:hypothetical protein